MRHRSSFVDPAISPAPRRPLAGGHVGEAELRRDIVEESSRLDRHGYAGAADCGLGRVRAALGPGSKAVTSCAVARVSSSCERIP